jgi:superfamily II DNA or RNA helicase
VFFNTRLFGFSATWDARADGTSPRLEYLLGPVLFHMTWQEATALGLIVPVQVRWINVVTTVDPCARYKQDVAKRRHGIWCHTYRNQLIADAAQKHGPDEQTLILVQTIEHAVLLGQLLPEYTLCYDQMEPVDLHTYKQRGQLPPDYIPMDSRRRDELRSRFETGEVKKVIATDVWSTGVSFEQLAVLIRADARSSDILDDQAPGRVVRTHEASGKTHALIYDCWDAFNDSFLRKSRMRWRNYAKKGWEQQRPSVLRTEV